jgi:hypothetical protein
MRNANSEAPDNIMCSQSWGNYLWPLNYVRPLQWETNFHARLKEQIGPCFLCQEECSRRLLFVNIGHRDISITIEQRKCMHTYKYVSWGGFGRMILVCRQLLLGLICPLLGNDSLHTFCDNKYAGNNRMTFVSVQRRCKYNIRGSGVFYAFRIYPLLGNGRVFHEVRPECI